MRFAISLGLLLSMLFAFDAIDKTPRGKRTSRRGVVTNGDAPLPPIPPPCTGNGC